MHHATRASRAQREGPRDKRRLIRNVPAARATFLRSMAGATSFPGSAWTRTSYFIILPDGVGITASFEPATDALAPPLPLLPGSAGAPSGFSARLGLNSSALDLGTSMGCRLLVWVKRNPILMDAADAGSHATCAGSQDRNHLRKRYGRDSHRIRREGRRSFAKPRPGLPRAPGPAASCLSAPLYMARKPCRPGGRGHYRSMKFQDAYDRTGRQRPLVPGECSRNYDPSPQLGKITAHVCTQSADDFISRPNSVWHDSNHEGKTTLRRNPHHDETRGPWNTYAGRWFEQYLRGTARKISRTQICRGPDTTGLYLPVRWWPGCARNFLASGEERCWLGVLSCGRRMDFPADFPRTRPSAMTRALARRLSSRCG